LAGQACSYTDGELEFSDGFIAGNVVISGTATFTFATLNITSTAVINGTGRGYPASSGAGSLTATVSNTPVCGGSHAGCADATCTGSTHASPRVYGTTLTPSSMGSGGCTYASADGSIVAAGGAGGAALTLKVGDWLQLDGTIEMNGLPGQVNNGYYGGGGAGGSVWIQAQTLLRSSGRVRADGGHNGVVGFYAGQASYGGSGGRIKLGCSVSSAIPFDPATESLWPVAMSAYSGCTEYSAGTPSGTVCSGSGTVVVDCGVAPLNVTQLALARAATGFQSLLPETPSTAPPILLVTGRPGLQLTAARPQPFPTPLMGLPQSFNASSILIRDGGVVVLNDDAFAQGFTATAPVAVTVSSGCITAVPPCECVLCTHLTPCSRMTLQP